MRIETRLLALVQAIAVAWPASAIGMLLHTPGPTPPVDDDEDDDDDIGRGSGGGNIDPDDDEGAADDDEDEDEDTLWAGSAANDLDVTGGA
jgi:hypothetical protein